MEIPTVAEYVRRVKAAAGPGARRTYATYWDRMATMWGERPMTGVAATDIEFLKNESAASAASRRNSRHGRHAGEHAVAAARALFNFATADGIIAVGDSPAHRVAKPRRLPNTRRALTAPELDQINLARGARARSPGSWYRTRFSASRRSPAAR